jgi:glycyl-tRNA synthetase beta chain
MPHLLLELGCEELPASSVANACAALADGLRAGIEERRLGHELSVRTACTPRRLIVGIDGVAAMQSDDVAEKRGPSAKSAYSASGDALPPLTGFCKSLGIDPSAVETRDDYVWARVEIKGRRAHEVLPEILRDAIGAIAFEKTMRWGDGRMRFARPIRWLLFAFDGERVPCEIEGVEAAISSRGHRFDFPEPFEARTFDELCAALRVRRVEPDPDSRRHMIVEGTQKVAQGEAVLDNSLVDENTFLTEWPTPIRGEFHEQFIRLPEPVLITAMAKHERFFPIRDASGELDRGFVSVTNSGDESQVRRGNEWVLNARFNDALFFFDEDSRSTLAQFLEKSASILFQERLGTIRQRANRISSLAGVIAEESGMNAADREVAASAGLLCKADLSTGLVSELPSLQGTIGGEYAKRDGLRPQVCNAIARHYDPDFSAGGDGGGIAAIVMCADQADRLAGYLGIGESPKGSSDPYALRRAVTMLIDAQMANGALTGSVHNWLRWARAGYDNQAITLDADEKIVDRFEAILLGRYSALFEDLPHDALESAWTARSDQNCREFVSRARAVAALSCDIDFVRTARRPNNIVAAAIKSGDAIADANSTDLLTHEAEQALVSALSQSSSEFDKLNASGDYTGLADRLRALKAPIDAVFDAVMVMDENPAIRAQRLSLMRRVANYFRYLGDFSKIVIEGEST